MKAPLENNQEPQKDTVQRVQQEPSTGEGGEATMADNRPATAVQRKLRSAMGSAEDTTNPIQRKTSPKPFGSAQQPRSRRNKTGLPDKLKTGIENLSGYSMDDVKVHYNSSKPAQLQAHAYAQGTDIHLASGQQKHLPHEAWHVVQQKQGRVKPTVQFKGKVSINDDTGLEKEADVMGNMALQERRINPPSMGHNFSQKGVLMEKLIQRKKTTEYKSFTDLKKLSLKKLDEYANNQADWHVSPGLKDYDRNSIREILKFFRSHDRISSSCRAFKVEEVITALVEKSKDEVFSALKYFSNLMAKSYPFEMSGVFKLEESILVGEKIKTLLDHFPKYILKIAMNKRPFNDLKTIEDVNKLVDYYEKAYQKPVFQSSSKFKDANDFGAYIALNKDKYPLDYDSTSLKGVVRNYHRFEKNALDKLNTNMGDTSKTKPLTLILHSAIDHNGAYLHDKKLTALINNNNLHVIMVEGYETLSEYKNQIEPMAKKYGRNDTIDQVMFAGHGNSKSIQLGGKVEEGKKHRKGEMEEISDKIDLKNNSDASIEIFNEVLDHMSIATDPSKEPHRRILFNACLTNSNSLAPYEVEYKEGDKDKVSFNLKEKAVSRTDIIKHYREWLTENKNLVDTLMDLANKKNTDVTKVVGSMASHGSLDMFDNKNNLDLISDYDPKLTAKNKIEYVKYGIDPKSVIMAVHELWVKLNPRDKKDLAMLAVTFGYKSYKTTLQTLFLAVKKRSGKKSIDWHNVIIESIFKLLIVPANWENVNYIFGMSKIAQIINKAPNEVNCKVNQIRKICSIADVFGIDYKDLESVFFNIKNTEYWETQHFMPTVFLQVWMIMNSEDSILKGFIYSISRYSDIKMFLRFIDINFLASNKLLEKIFTDKNQDVAIKMALIGTLKKNSYCIDFLKDRLVDNKFPEELKIEEALGNVTTELKILEILGVYSPPTNKTNDKPSINNIKIFGEKKNINTYSVTSVTKTGKIKQDASIFLDISRESNEEDGTLKKGTICYILGSNGMWWAIEYTYKETLTTAFIKKDDVKTK